MNPPPERIVTDWRRFSTGLWRMPRGDIANAYCADQMPKVSVFMHAGRRFTNCGCAYSKSIRAQVRGYPLIVPDEYRGADSVPYSYEGREVVFKGKTFRLGTEVLFVASDPVVADWRRLLRVMFVDGGYFAADCDYPQFITERCRLDEGNGLIAAGQELADCNHGTLPRAKAEMRQWLDTGKKAAAEQLGLEL